MDYKSGGLLPFPRTGCVPNASVMLTQNDEQGSTGNVEILDESPPYSELIANSR